MMQRKEILIFKSRSSCYLFRFMPISEDMVRVLQQAANMVVDEELDFNDVDYQMVKTTLFALAYGSSGGVKIY